MKHIIALLLITCFCSSAQMANMLNPVQCAPTGHAMNILYADTNDNWKLKYCRMDSCMFVTNDSIKVYKLNGSVQSKQIKIIADTVSVTGSSSGYVIDISALGYTVILGVNVIAYRNSATVTSSPNVSIKTISTSAITVNIIEGNPATVNILGNIITLGSPVIFSPVSGLKLSVMVIGY